MLLSHGLVGRLLFRPRHVISPQSLHGFLHLLAPPRPAHPPILSWHFQHVRPARSVVGGSRALGRAPIASVSCSGAIPAGCPFLGMDEDRDGSDLAARCDPDEAGAKSPGWRCRAVLLVSRCVPIVADSACGGICPPPSSRGLGSRCMSAGAALLLLGSRTRESIGFRSSDDTAWDMMMFALVFQVSWNDSRCSRSYSDRVSRLSSQCSVGLPCRRSRCRRLLHSKQPRPLSSQVRHRID